MELDNISMPYMPVQQSSYWRSSIVRDKYGANLNQRQLHSPGPTTLNRNYQQRTIRYRHDGMMA